MAQAHIKPPPGFELDTAAPPAPSPADVQPPSGFEMDQQRSDQLMKEPGVLHGTAIANRFAGTDVQDKIPFTRLSSVIAGAIGYGALGAQAGGALGSLAGPVGAGVGAAAGGLAGSVIGAGAGAVAPESMMALGEGLGIVKEGTAQKYGLAPQDLKTVLEGEMLLEAATAGGVAAARLGGRAMTRMITAPGRVGRETAEQAAVYGINTLPVQVGSRNLPRSFVSIFGRFPIVGANLDGVNPANLPGMPFKAVNPSGLTQRARNADAALAEAFASLPNRIAPAAAMTDISVDIFKDARMFMQKANAQFEKEYATIFAKADAQGVTIKPINTVQRAQDLITQITKNTPKAAKNMPAVQAGDTMTNLRRFMQNKIMPIAGPNGELAPQSLQQMDTLLETIDGKIGELARNNQGFAVKYLVQLRQSVTGDMMTMGRGKMAKAGGTPPADIGKELRELDARFSATMQTVFETATAKKFNRVQRRALRGVSFDEATSIPVDHLGDLLIKSDSPSMVDDLVKLIQPDTMNKLVAATLSRRLEQASIIGSDGVATAFDTSKFVKSLGLNSPTSARYLQTEKMLQASGGVAMSDLKTLAKIGEALGSVEIPDASQFVARKAMLNGIKGIMGGIGMGLVATGQVGATHAMAGIGFVGGGRLLASMISNPDSARALHRVLGNETRTAARRMLWIKAVRTGLYGLEDAGTIGKEELQQRLDAADAYMEEWQNQSERATGE